ncbi:MAG: polysaccharide deacetylase family protein [Ruminococcaceae bacterium]|nr:polysaccharide deacetylase family protein [Oscillospiraceae bacterium]
MSISNKTKGRNSSIKKSSLLKIISVFTLTAIMTGCSADDMEDFFDLTPAVRTPPHNVSAVPVVNPQINNENAPIQNEITPPTETEPAETEPMFEKPDRSQFTEYPNMWVEKYVGKYEKKEKTIYLTFDDGPSKYTEDILRILKEYNIKATFFVIPDESKECADRLRTIAAAGHTIGVHSYTHNYLTIYEDEQAYLEDFANAYDIITKVTNQKPWLYRFPGGSVNQYNRHCRDEIKAALDERGFVYYDWNTDSNDWRGLSPEELCLNVTNDVKRFPSATVLMHDTDTRENTVAALENIIKCLKESGYRFAPITQTVEPIQYGVNF